MTHTMGSFDVKQLNSTKWMAHYFGCLYKHMRMVHILNSKN